MARRCVERVEIGLQERLQIGEGELLPCPRRGAVAQTHFVGIDHSGLGGDAVRRLIDVEVGPGGCLIADVVQILRLLEPPRHRGQKLVDDVRVVLQGLSKFGDRVESARCRADEVRQEAADPSRRGRLGRIVAGADRRHGRRAGEVSVVQRRLRREHRQEVGHIDVDRVERADQARNVEVEQIARVRKLVAPVSSRVRNRHGSTSSRLPPKRGIAIQPGGPPAFR